MKSLNLFAGTVAGLALATIVAANSPAPAFNLFNDALPTQHQSLSFNPSPQTIGPVGGIYTAAPLVQDGISAFYIAPAMPYNATFDGAGEVLGDNLAGTAGGFFTIVEAATVLGNGNLLIQAEITARNAAGNPEPWVATGVFGPNGPFTSWRMDLGTLAAAPNKIAVAGMDSLVDSGFSVFNSAGSPLASFAMSLDASDPFGVAGVGIVGLGGADIAGFDMASIQLFWEVSVLPAPGSLALLGLAGLVGVRRRRN